VRIDAAVCGIPFRGLQVLSPCIGHRERAPDCQVRKGSPFESGRGLSPICRSTARKPRFQARPANVIAPRPVPRQLHTSLSGPPGSPPRPARAAPLELVDHVPVRAERELGAVAHLPCDVDDRSPLMQQQRAETSTAACTAKPSVHRLTAAARPNAPPVPPRVPSSRLRPLDARLAHDLYASSDQRPPLAGREHQGVVRRAAVRAMPPPQILRERGEQPHAAALPCLVRVDGQRALADVLSPQVERLAGP
jgi:hypothetical protein